jgi:hypothetical protein
LLVAAILSENRLSNFSLSDTRSMPNNNLDCLGYC